MKSKQNIFVLTFFLILSYPVLTSCGPRLTEPQSSLTAGGIPRGQLKGYVAIHHILQDRLLTQVPGKPPFSLGSYVGLRGSRLRGLALLFGGFSGSGPTNRYRNGQPNPLNSMLWDLVLTGFAGDLAKLCRHGPEGPLPPDSPTTSLPPSLTLNETASEVITALCSWPQGSHSRSMDELWDLVMGPNDFNDEKAAWKEFFLNESSPFATRGPEETLSTMLRLIFLNPYFLLEEE